MPPPWFCVHSMRFPRSVKSPTPQSRAVRTAYSGSSAPRYASTSRGRRPASAPTSRCSHSRRRSTGPSACASRSAAATAAAACGPRRRRPRFRPVPRRVVRRRWRARSASRRTRIPGGSRARPTIRGRAGAATAPGRPRPRRRVPVPGAAATATAAARATPLPRPPSGPTGRRAREARPAGIRVRRLATDCGRRESRVPRRRIRQAGGAGVASVSNPLASSVLPNVRARPREAALLRWDCKWRSRFERASNRW